MAATSWSAVDGNDRIFGGSGDDILSGLDGNDTLHGGAGTDRLSCGDNADIASLFRGGRTYDCETVSYLD